jgi:hypothetical protein
LNVSDEAKCSAIVQRGSMSLCGKNSSSLGIIGLIPSSWILDHSCQRNDVLLIGTTNRSSGSDESGAVLGTYKLV